MTACAFLFWMAYSLTFCRLGIFSLSRLAARAATKFIISKRYQKISKDFPLISAGKQLSGKECSIRDKPEVVFIVSVVHRVWCKWKKGVHSRCESNDRTSGYLLAINCYRFTNLKLLDFRNGSKFFIDWTQADVLEKLKRLQILGILRFWLVHIVLCAVTKLVILN